jgi:hypothetical protein
VAVSNELKKEPYGQACCLPNFLIKILDPGRVNRFTPDSPFRRCVVRLPAWTANFRLRQRRNRMRRRFPILTKRFSSKSSASAVERIPATAAVFIAELDHVRCAVDEIA